MFLTVCYAYATMMQWWRLRSLRDKLKGTLNDQNALLVCCGALFSRNRNRSLENLLFRYDTKIGCTVVPRQKVNLNQWVAFPKNPRYFPIHIEHHQHNNNVDVNAKSAIFIRLQAVLDRYDKHHSEIIQVETYGQLVAWRASDQFEVILKTDIDFLTKLILKFSKNDLDINHELQLSRIETVDVDNSPAVIKYDKRYLMEETMKYSCSPVHWSKFVGDIKDLYSKIRDVTNPRIKIENGSPKPVENEPLDGVVKPRDVKNTLDVSARRHKRPSPKNRTKKKMAAIGKSKEVVENDVTVSPKKSSKPPNVLVYADSLLTKDNVKRLLYSILDKEKYTIYDLPTSPQSPVVWNSSTVLVVVCGSVPDVLTSQLIDYFLTGGKLLCLCSDLMYSVLYTFTTAEVREHELVRFTYGPWQRVKMMHHIFCYQASPAKKQFSKDSDQSNHSGSNESSPQTPRTPSRVDLRHNDQDYNIQVEVLGTEETWQTPSLLLAKVKSSRQSAAIFSQVHLEIDPEQYENDDDKYESLRSSNVSRLEIFRDILEKHLDMVCDNNVTNVKYTPAYFLGRFQSKMTFLSECDSIRNNQLTCDKVGVIFCANEDVIGDVTDIRLPVMIHSCPPNFSTVNYFEALKTTVIGRLVIYGDVMSSTQHLLSKTLRHGLVVIAKQQTNGYGRASNTWLSPIGCAMFSLQLHIDLESNLGQFLSLVQHVTMTAVVRGVKNAGYGCLNLGIKWPNDLYADGCVKIGGIIANSAITSSTAVVNVGCGVNLSNHNPTVCVNDLIERHNRTSTDNLESMTYERFFAVVFNEIETLLDSIERNGVDSFFDCYYANWLHAGHPEVTIQDGNGDSLKATIEGVDSYGFLRVKNSTTGEIMSVQPDGNTFDMMKGLIGPKTF